MPQSLFAGLALRVAMDIRYTVVPWGNMFISASGANDRKRIGCNPTWSETPQRKSDLDSLDYSMLGFNLYLNAPLSFIAPFLSQCVWTIHTVDFSYILSQFLHWRKYTPTISQDATVSHWTGPKSGIGISNYQKGVTNVGSVWWVDHLIYRVSNLASNT